ncbi:MAG TPA: SGNH/GDSL hydrolase family protein [Solirubrobacteraceae bacterium]|jgi:lysophospholipase L1-like esterase|nr:SGNH/GDSL hydrolase family protein [Solirubrobacteraceae bacterium]
MKAWMARATLVSMALALGVAAPGTAASRPPVTPGSTYLALGDSVTFGYQEPNTVPAPNYHNAASFLGYPEELGPQLKLKIANAACPGETSSSLINPHAESNGCENRLGKAPGYRTLYPLHVRYKGSQLAFAIQFLRSHPSVRLVSLMIGANDLFVCQETTPDACLKPSEQRKTLAKVQRNIRTILSQLRNTAGYRGQLVIVKYYSLNYASALINAFSRELNQAEVSASKPFGVAIADGYGIFAKATQKSGGNTCTAGLITQTPSPPKCGVHPTYAGSALLAQAVAKAVRLR